METLIAKYRLWRDFEKNNFFEYLRLENEVEKLLGATITGGVTLGDYLFSDGLQYRISPELYAEFENLVGKKNKSKDDVRDVLMEKIEQGDIAVPVLLNKIKGQLGENLFMTEAQTMDIRAKLAEFDRQEGWDVAIDRIDETQFVRVMLDIDTEAVVEEITRINDQLEVGELKYEGAQIEQIDFAVPESIYDEVSAMVANEAMNVEVFPVALSAEEQYNAFDLKNLFNNLFDTMIPTIALHNMVSAFQAYKDAEALETFVGDPVLQANIAIIKVNGGLLAEELEKSIFDAFGLSLMPVLIRTSMPPSIKDDNERWLERKITHEQELIPALG